MSDLYYDTKRGNRQSANQLSRRGLLRAGVDLEGLGIVPLIADHDIDIELYIPVDTGTVEIGEDGKAYIVYAKKNKMSNPGTGFDVRRVMKDKVNSRRDLIMVSGLKFSIEGETHILQTRNAVDLVNWNTVYGKAQAVDAEPLIKVRTEADKSKFIPAGSMITLLGHMITYRTAIMDASWSLKDAIESATTESDAFEVYETGIDTVWPDDSPIQL